MIVEVVISRPLLFSLHYRYLFNDFATIGTRVLVPLGQSTVVGIIIAVLDKSPHKNLKTVQRCLDKRALLDNATLTLLQWTSRYYHHPLGQVMFTALPWMLRKDYLIPKISCWKLTHKKSLKTFENLRNAPKQQQLLKKLQQFTSPITEKKLLQIGGSRWKILIQALQKKNLVTHFSLSFDTIKQHKNRRRVLKIELSLAENKQLQALKTKVFQKTPVPIYYKQVFGYSIKSDINFDAVYIHLMQEILQQKKQILLLIPAIHAATHLMTLLQPHFKQVAVLHSGISHKQYLQTWLAIQTGQIDLVIGTRSVIFAPFKQLGLIIINHEHNALFKQSQQKFAYHARNVAIKRAYDLNIPLILASITPSLDILNHIKQGRYSHCLSIDEKKINPPNILVQDIRVHQLDAGIAPPVIEIIKTTLQMGQQVLLFLNRRGFATTLFCQHCGWIATCQQCNYNLTFHAHVEKISCHRCQTESFVMQHCPYCKSTHLSTQGEGTERLALTLRNYFPATKIIRIDSDSAGKNKLLQEKFTQIKQAETSIVIGTQLILQATSRPDLFSNLTLICLLNIDQALLSMQLQSMEKLAQSMMHLRHLLQSTGKKTNLLLQTCQPNHSQLVKLLRQGYIALCKELLQEREIWNFPPFSYQILLKAQASDKSVATGFLQQIKMILDNNNKNRFHKKINIFGPRFSLIKKHKNQYRSQLLLNSQSRAYLHQAVDNVVKNIAKIAKNQHIHWSIDVDPIDFK